MNFNELKKVFKKVDNKDCDPLKQRGLLELIADEKNENVIKQFLYKEIDSIHPIMRDVEKVNFRKIYRNIRHILPEGNYDGKTKFQPKPLYMNIAKYSAILIIAMLIGGLISYYLFKRQPAFQKFYTEIEAPLGSKTKTILPDGSFICLNAGSKISYTEQYNVNDREINLEGEGYFKVTKNRYLPFVVNAKDLKIVAVGTEFNIKAYKGEDIIETTLIEGKIAIQSIVANNEKDKEIFLEPNQKAIYLAKNRELNIEDIKSLKQENNIDAIEPTRDGIYILKELDIESNIAWTENKLIIKSETLESIAVKLERKYDVSIQFCSTELKNFRFSGTLLDETLQQVLDAITLSAPIIYTIEGKTVTIKEDPKMKNQFLKHMKGN